MADKYDQSIAASATMTMPNGGKVTMTGTPEATFEEAVKKLKETHEQYLESGGWGGGR
jgi:hypothetical protein